MAGRAKQPAVSVIITAHNEGILAHKTMLSVFRAACKLDEAGIRYEIVIHIDKGDTNTKAYFARYKKDGRVRLFENDFGDLAASRNFSIQQARGDYIALADADDVYSENWLINFYEVVKGKRNTVARFQYILTFGGERTVITDCTNLTDQEVFLYGFDSNIYGSPCMFHRRIYEETPQRHNEPPFGYEDWQWLLDTQARGIKHVVAPETVLFYRRDALAKTSLLSGQVSYRAVLSKTPFFDFPRLKKTLKTWSLEDIRQMVYPANKTEAMTLKHHVKRSVYLALSFANRFSLYRRLRHAIKGGASGESAAPYIPDSLLREWKAINTIEKMLYPDEYILEKLDIYWPDKRMALGYLRCINALRKRPDTVVFVPWLNPGGADKVFINTCNEIQQQLGWSIAVMQTERSSSPWKEKLNKSIDFINLDEEFDNIDYERQMDLMAMFLVQNDVQRLVIANSFFGYHFVRRYKKLIKRINLKVYVFSFNGMISEYGRIGGFAHEHLPGIYDSVYKVITDNSAISQEMMQAHGYLEDKYTVHHQFIDDMFTEPQQSENKQSLRILWASRLTRQKMPEVLAAINERVQGKHTIDVYGRLEDSYDQQFIEANNLHYIREFDGLDDLPTSDYDIFVYTANADGLPNMLLEVAAKGLPIIAPHVGGIGDFIKDGVTGLLIADYQDVDAYVSAIDRLRDGALRYRLAKGAQRLLAKEFTVTRWKKEIKEIFDR